MCGVFRIALTVPMEMPGEAVCQFPSFERILLKGIGEGGIPAHKMEVTFQRKTFVAWIALCAALSVHVTDEAITGFLDLYNFTVLALHLPVPTFSFSAWISLLILAIIGLLILSYWVRRGTWWTVFASYAFGALMLANGVAHLVFSIYKKKWMPGAYTSPLLIVAAIYLMVETACSRSRGVRHRL